MINKFSFIAIIGLMILAPFAWSINHKADNLEIGFCLEERFSLELFFAGLESQ